MTGLKRAISSIDGKAICVPAENLRDFTHAAEIGCTTSVMSPGAQV
ncbi:MAG: hypothetical protein FWB85_09750 [Chitinispirillia bacterium]|nr:hypothetical protein [Chitinispirillia bacterium]MCL2242483.1 hypothetical protein [Chitinispirillia bacterium]